MRQGALLRPASAAVIAVAVLAAPVAQARSRHHRHHRRHSAAPLAVGVRTIVDPVRGGGEPYIALDQSGNPWVTAPGGSTVLTSYFYRSNDQGQTFQLQGPPGGHWLCPTGGSDSSILIDRITRDVFLVDQQSLAQVATARVPNGTGAPESACLAAPAMGADRPFQALLHPTGSRRPLQFVEDGGKPIVYMSWDCGFCLGGGGKQGGLAFAWSYDGVHWHAADPGVPQDNLVANQFYEAPVAGDGEFSFHGTMVADPRTGYVFKAVSCGGACPNGSAKNEFGVLVGKPGRNRTDPANVGQFSSMTYQTAANKLDGKDIPETGSLFPVVAMDSAGTLYEAWVQGDGFADPNSAPPASSWHVYYSYSKDQPDHKVWSAPIRVDRGPDVATNVMVWMVAGDRGRLGFVWLGSPTREHPSKLTPEKEWHPFMAVATRADSARPRFQQARVGREPNHLGDICLQGLNCSATVPPGNRNMADFISIDVAPDGFLEATWTNDANRISNLPTSIVPGVPLDEVARQVSGPRLIGRGGVATRRFSARATTGSIADRRGDAGYGGPSLPQLDLTGQRVRWDGKKIEVALPVAGLPTMTSPDSGRPNVWWITTWLFHHHLYFAKAEAVGGGEVRFTAGSPSSYDRPGLAPYTIPQVVDYRGGTPVSGRRVGDSFVIDVPPALVGNPGRNDVLDGLTSWTMLANQNPPFATLGPGNLPAVVDSTPSQNALLAIPQPRRRAHHHRRRHHRHRG